MNKKKAFKISIKIAILLSVIIGFILINDQISDKNINTFLPVSDGGNYAYQVEKISVEENILKITGWFIELKKVRGQEVEVADGKNVGIVLYDMNSVTEKDLDGNEKPRLGVSMEMTYVVRDDINEYFKCEYDYSHCGFVASIDKSRINLEEGVYQIVIKPDRQGIDGIAINSCAYLNKGKLSYINPYDSIELEVKGTDLENIVNFGDCVFSYPEYHICVYQYDGRLYWIADENFYFEEDGSTYIEYQLETTQFDKLPESYTSLGWSWADSGWTFEYCELKDIDCGKYRVSVRDIPKDYSITIVTTGYYSGGNWIWQKGFKPIFLYK